MYISGNKKERTFFQKRKKQEMEKYRAVLIFYAGRSQKKNIVTSVGVGRIDYPLFL